MLLFLAVLCLGVLVGVTVRYPEGLLPSAVLESGQVEAQFSVDNAADPPQETSLASVEAEQIISADFATRRAEEDLHYKKIENQIAELLRRVENLEAEIRINRSGLRNDTGTPQRSVPTSKVSGPTGEAKLVAAGMDRSTAAWIQQQLDKNKLDELYLQNQASREGWLNTSRYSQARQDIQGRINAFREQLGDETFDRLLYALGRPNRVLIKDVMQGSPAQQIGFNASDAIVFYDGKRVFSIKELQALTGGGDTSSWVLVEVSREGEPLNLYAPGGPLGVRLTTGLMPPR